MNYIKNGLLFVTARELGLAKGNRSFRQETHITEVDNQHERKCMFMEITSQGETMKEVLKNFCKTIHIEYMGIAPIGPYVKLHEILAERRNHGYYTEFEEKNLLKRIDPRLTMDEVQSIIVCLFPYYSGQQPGDANLAKYASALDYHTLIKTKLMQIGTFLKSNIESFRYQAYVDNGPLVDRYLAYLAGLGFYGINSHIITERYGSYVLIGYILTNYFFPADRPLQRTCIKCGKCVKACPGQSIIGDFKINPRTCRSYLTQKKGELTPDEISILKTTKLVFGCDICQDVCPHNQNIEFTHLDEYRENLLYRIDRQDIAGLSNRDFRTRYGNRAFSWRGKNQLIKNFSYLPS